MILRRGPDALLFGAIVAFPLLLVAWQHSLGTVFFAVSADDFHRTLYAWEVTQGRLVPSDLWPPLQFWVEALALQIYPHLLSVPYLVNLIAATATLTCLSLLGRTLGLGRIATLAMLLLTGTIPWVVWLSLSGLAEPLFFLGIGLAYLGVARWRAHGHERGLWLAAIGLLAASMLRFDAWGHSAAFSLGVAWLWWRSPDPRPHRWLIAVAVPWLFAIAWLGNQYARHGDPFYFSKVTQTYFLAARGQLPLLERLTWNLRDLWAIGGPTVLVGAVGLWLMRRKPGIELMSAMWLGSFALLLYSTLNHTITLNHPIRLAVIHAVLLTPCCAFALQRLGRLGPVGMVVAVAFVLGMAVPRLAAVPARPDGVAPDVMEVGQHIRHLHSVGQIGPGQPIMIELIYWDHIPLRVITNDPGAVIYDRRLEPILMADGAITLDDATNPSILALPPAELQEALQQQEVRLVIAHSARAVENLSRFASESLHSGRFHVFLVGS